jgi:hypothetical protein
MRTLAVVVVVVVVVIVTTVNDGAVDNKFN